MPLALATITIAAGQSLSGAADLGEGELVRFYMPSLWTPANLSFQLSPDNLEFGDVFDAYGRETIINIVPGVAVVIALQWRALAWIKFRSGTRNAPVIQTATRNFRLILLK